MHRAKLSYKTIFIYSLPMIFIWTLYLIAYYPGVMSIDSLNQWGQIKRGIYWDGHPVVHTLFIKLLTSIWYSPAIVSLSQILITAWIISFGLCSFESFGVNKNLIRGFNLFFALFPTFGFMSVILWKDVLFSAFLLLFTILIIKIVITRGSYLESRNNQLFIIFSSSIICLFRHNGLLSFLGTIFLLLLFYRKFIKSVFTIFIATLIIYFFVKGPIYSLLNVMPTTTNETLAIPTQQIASVIKHDGYLTEDQKNYLDKILPLDQWKKNYNIRTVDPIKMHADFNKKIITNDVGKFLKTWLAIIKQNPKLAFKAYANQTAIVWEFNGIVNLANMKISNNGLGLKNTVIFPTVTNGINGLYKFTILYYYSWFFWRPAIFMYLSILATVISTRRNSLSSVIPFAPMFINIFTYLLAIPAPDFRYLYANLLITPFIILFSFINFKKLNVE